MQQTSPMQPLIMLMLLIMIETPAHAFAQESSPSPASSNLGEILTASLSREGSTEPANSFTAETPKINLRWHGETLHRGDRIRCIWIAENVGKAAPANYHVDENTVTANEPQAAGTFTLSKPKTDWPEGKYRAEIYVGTELVATLPFTIEKLRGD
jgi:hypothetical protein